jgi:two-component system, NtrC family, response regulator
MAKILVVDDDITTCLVLQAMCSTLGHEVILAHSLGDALKQANSDDHDLVLLDINLPDGSGLETLPKLRRTRSAPEIIILTGHGDAEAAEIAIKAGAWDYILKPARIAEMSLSITRALQYREANLGSRSFFHLQGSNIVGDSPRMAHCLDLVAQAAGSNVNILITGETGAGKEVIAEVIHRNSPRSDRPFMVVDCSSLPEHLVESALFGHVKGAFTGADQPHEGLIKAADGGTLFLDEIGELPPGIQKNFLRVLQERRFRPVGSAREIGSDFRLIAATNRDLDRMVRDGGFREDLLFRVQTIKIDVPPRRERKEDFFPLMSHFMTQLHAQYGRGLKGFSPDLLEALQAYAWPGNVRELKNAIESSYVASGWQPTLYPNHLPYEIRIHLKKESVKPAESEHDRPTRFDMPLSIDEARKKAEKQYLEDLLAYTGGNMKKAGEISGLSPSQLYALFRRNGISLRPEKKDS